MEEAAVRLEDLFLAHTTALLAPQARHTDGTAPANALVVDCPSCGRPSMVALDRQGPQPMMSLWPVRTAQDAKFLEASSGVTFLRRPA